MGNPICCGARGGSEPVPPRRHPALRQQRPVPDSVKSGEYLSGLGRRPGCHAVAIPIDEVSFAPLRTAGGSDRSESTDKCAALVLPPRRLAGIVQRVDRPIRITRHWRLAHPGGWLTLQLRYVVFHGPVKWILSGNHGVKIDPAQSGCSIDQAATLGFSANLGYGVARCEMSQAYLSGKKALFNDCFSDGPGYYVQTARPRPAKTTLLPGRGAEGVLNSRLKILGL